LRLLAAHVVGGGGSRCGAGVCFGSADFRQCYGDGGFGTPTRLFCCLQLSFQFSHLRCENIN
jgi:hypothetical protein